jgi:hypothetical protein
VSEEKARKREEKYQDQIKQLNIRLKQADSRFHSNLSFIYRARILKRLCSPGIDSKE